MRHKNVAHIDDAAIAENYCAVRDFVRQNSKHPQTQAQAQVKVISVVKADAYGHGIEICATALGDAGCSFFAVSSEEEALELRRIEKNNGREPDILILGHIMPENAAEMAKNNITCAVVSYENAALISQVMQNQKQKLKIHVKLDTGMNRVGFPADEDSVCNTAEKLREISEMSGVKITGIFTHFSCADTDLHDNMNNYAESYTALQLKRYNLALDKITSLGVDVGLRHAANSAAILGLPDSYFDAVRAGIILYGYSPSGDVAEAKRFCLKPVMRFDSTVVHIHKVPAGGKISYGGTFTAPHNMTVATIAAGYADGYERSYTGSLVRIHDKLYPSVGRICMDQFMIDITGNESEVKIGDSATLLGGDNGELTEALAHASHSINYEVICKIAKRVTRQNQNL